jgi:hypothetical protein
MDWLILGVFVLILGRFLWKIRQRKLEAATTVVAREGRFSVVFAKDVAASALPVEVDLCAEAEQALVAMAWDDVGRNGILFWPVRTASQIVIYRGRRVPWNEIGQRFFPRDPLRQDADKKGYGGMKDGKSIYVAFYHEGRAPDALMAHELTHAKLVGVDHGEERFLAEERKLLAEIRG